MLIEAYPLRNQKVKKERGLFTLKAKESERKAIKCKPEKHWRKRFLKFLRRHNDFYNRKFKSPFTEEIYIKELDVLLKAACLSVDMTLVVSEVGATVGFPIVGAQPSLQLWHHSSQANLSKLKINYAKLEEFEKMVTILFGEILEIFLLGKANDQMKQKS